jgi:hypothetical protein
MIGTCRERKTPKENPFSQERTEREKLPTENPRTSRDRKLLADDPFFFNKETIKERKDPERKAILSSKEL